MKILALGLDKSALNSNSPLAQRLIGYGSLVERYDLIVPSAEKKRLVLSERVVIYGSGGQSKLSQLARLKIKASILILQNHYQVVSVQDQHYLGLLGWLLARFFGLGLEIQIHGWENKSGLRLKIAGFLIKRADSIRVVSDRLRTEIMNNFNVQGEKITTVPIYVDKSAATVLPALKERTAKKFVFLTVGRLVPVKNINLQIEALAAVKKQYPQVELWIAGDGREKQNLVTSAKRLGLEKSVRFLGQVNSFDFYRQADCFVLSSNEEGYGLAVLEAALSGLPIIMTNVGLAGEFIRDQENGLVIPVGDGQALTRAMVKIISDEKIARWFGAAARQTALALPGQAENFNLYQQSWQRAAAASGGKAKKLLREHGWYLLVLLLVAAAGIFIRFTCLPFTSTASDSVQYMETAKYLIGQGGVAYPQRLLKPLAPLGVGLLSFFTGGRMETALLVEVAIFYLFLALAIYYLLNLFFKNKFAALLGSLVYITAYPLLKFGLDLYTETGANLFWVLAIALVWQYYQRPTTKKFYLINLVVIVGLLWKEYSLLGAVLLWLVIFFRQQIGRREKILLLFLSSLMVFGFLVLTQVIVFARYHYSYFNWYQAGTDISEGTDYHPYFIVKSLFAVYLLGWALVVLGLFRWRQFSSNQRFFLKCLVPPSLMFLLWTGVSSRLYFVLAPLLTILAVEGLQTPFLKKKTWQAAIVAVVIAGNFYWLFANDFFRSLIQMSQWR